MTEEPYRWLEAIENRREYIQEQLKPSSPVFAASVDEGVLLLGVGGGLSKVFEIFDRHAMVALGHPADIERMRQGLIDAAHLESFTRAAEDVSLRRLVSFGLSVQLKTSFEQIFTAPFLVETLLAEVGATREQDVLARVRFDGSFELENGGVMVACAHSERERVAKQWLAQKLASDHSLETARKCFLAAWVGIMDPRAVLVDGFEQALTSTEPCKLLDGKIVEVGLLRRSGPRSRAYQAWT